MCPSCSGTGPPLGLLREPRLHSEPPPALASCHWVCEQLCHAPTALTKAVSWSRSPRDTVSPCPGGPCAPFPPGLCPPSLPHTLCSRRALQAHESSRCLLADDPCIYLAMPALRTPMLGPVAMPSPTLRQPCPGSHPPQTPTSSSVRSRSNLFTLPTFLHPHAGEHLFQLQLLLWLLKRPLLLALVAVSKYGHWTKHLEAGG